MRILKFGGTSVATAQRRQVVATLVEIALASGPVVVVTSALGGVTDRLVAAIDAAVDGEGAAQRIGRLDDLRRLHLDDLPTAVASREAARQVNALLDDLSRRLDGIALLGDCPNTTRHHLLALGERLALPLVSLALGQRHLAVRPCDGSEILRTEGADGPLGEETAIDLPASRALTREWAEALPADAVPVVTGFVAADHSGRTTTLGRGASDLTATLLGSFLEAQSVEIWTDVDGVLSASPQWVESPRPLPRLSYAEAAEMARFGARVLHPRTLEPVRPTAIPVCIRNTMRPQDVGTCIGPSLSAASADRPPGSVRAITARGGHVLLNLGGGGLTLYRELYAALEALEIEPLLLMHGSGGSSISMLVARCLADVSIRNLRRRLHQAHRSLTVERQDGVSVVAAIGDGTQPTHLAGRMLDALRDEDIDSLALALPSLCGRSDEHAVAILVDDDDVPRTVRRLHRDLVATPAMPQEVPLRRAQIRHEPLTRLL